LINLVPTVPILLSPANGSSNVTLTPTLFWNTVPNTTSYTTQVSPTNTFSFIVDSTTVTTNQRTIPVGKLNIATTYYWRVKANNQYGSSLWSDVWNFFTIITGIQKSSSEIPREYKLYNNYPNPFNPETNIKFDISKNSFTKLIIYNILGKEVTTLVNEYLSAGSYTVKWNANNKVPSGVYFYKITSCNFDGSGQIFSDVKRMILLK
ncbi:MAG: T9SS type A sorting domain-containing protein, partial [Ignavibacteriae bacterium]|nr:T9SS type A sorting domain-containing protein [Ignavibacteriota bacterium]